MMKFEFNISGKKNPISLEKSEDGFKAYLKDKIITVRASRIDNEFIVLDINGEHYTVFIGENRGCYSVMVREEVYTVERASPDAMKMEAVEAHAGEGNFVAAPMPGKVIKILCSRGDKVASGQTLAIIEAMKMENNIVAHRNAVIKDIRVKMGDQVTLSDPIIEFESEESSTT